jgi:hypothetical protein
MIHIFINTPNYYEAARPPEAVVFCVIAHRVCSGGYIIPLYITHKVQCNRTRILNFCPFLQFQSAANFLSKSSKWKVSEKKSERRNYDF